MRFGKKTRNLAAAGRRFLGERVQDESPAALVKLQEPDEVLRDEETSMPPPAPEESMVAGDPTQRLLTALGRFQRQVSRAEEGASQEAWCDECMNQLIVGIEIALNESWDDVKEALTDTARVLQTFEDAGRATDCVAFLKDSYEILCLMVGDLIVGNIRSGVMKKWRDRYERALNDLVNLGLTLVDDETSLEREEHRDTTADTDAHEFDTPDPFSADFGKPRHGDGVQSRDEGDAFDALLDPSGLDASLFEASHTVPEKAVDPFEETEGESSPFDTALPAQDTEASALPSLDDLLDTDPGATDDSSDMTLSSDFTADEATPSMADNNGLSAPYETAPEEEVFSEDDSDSEVEDALDDSSDAESAEPEDSGLDTSVDESDPEPVAEPEPVAAPEPTPEPEPEPGSPQALWKTAQEAMALGNVGDAKRFALQLAVNMAQLEVAQSEAQAAEVEAQIGATSDEVAQAEQAARDAEERLKALEEQISQGQKGFDEKREHVQHLRDDVSSAESAVEDLDRQIAELEARRNDEQARLAECQTILDDNLSEESRMQAELDGLIEEEGGARENLDSVRERVKDLQQTGTSHEDSLKAAQTKLEARRQAVLDIEKTIGHMGGAPESAQKEPEQADDQPEPPHDETGEAEDKNYESNAD